MSFPQIYSKRRNEFPFKNKNLKTVYEYRGFFLHRKKDSISSFCAERKIFVSFCTERKIFKICGKLFVSGLKQNFKD
jgi:hypothetical protein